MTAKEILRFLLPPFLWQLLVILKRSLLPSAEGLTYTPLGWATPLPAGANDQASWNTFLANQQADCEELIAQYRSGTPLSLDPNDLMRQLLFGYVIMLTAHLKRQVSVLDYGAAVGGSYWLFSTLVPDVKLEFHGKEVPATAERGRLVTPSATWHTDDSCFDRSYDLLVFSSSLEYLPDWREVLRRAALSTSGYLLISDMPTVRRVAEYVAVQCAQGLHALYLPVNSAELVAIVEGAGLHLVHEFDMGPHPHIKNAPEQPACVGWLFARRPPAS